MSVGRVIGELTRAIQQADRRQQAMGLPPVSEDTSRSWDDWDLEIISRVNALRLQTVSDGRPGYGLTVAVGVQVLGLLLAIDRAEQLDVTSGQEAA